MLLGDKLFELPRTDRLARYTHYALLFVVPANALRSQDDAEATDDGGST